MATSIVLTVIGDDRTGIVASLSELLAEHDANWQESSFSRLAGQFAGVVRACIPDEQVPACLAALDKLESEGLTVISHASLEGGDQPHQPGLLLQVVGNDSPGIVRRITGVLQSLDISVEALKTYVESASMAGDLLFHTQATVRLPEGVSEEQMRAELEAIAVDLMVEIKHHHGEP